MSFHHLYHMFSHSLSYSFADTALFPGMKRSKMNNKPISRYAEDHRQHANTDHHTPSFSMKTACHSAISAVSPGLQEATPTTSGGLRATLSCKQKFYVITNSQTMGVFTQWYAQFLEDGIDIDSGHMRRGGVKGMGLEVVPMFYYIIFKGKVSHVTSFLDNAIANAGNHPYHEVFIVRDELTALKFLSDKLHDDEVLRADF
ncbi:hypothetical protein EDD85DRAFT_794011 [Armillaria nabsnona]|nr:hypothetical protein EDD85DRAFT_794011 [Armillaria nabsnona]